MEQTVYFMLAYNMHSMLTARNIAHKTAQTNTHIHTYTFGRLMHTHAGSPPIPSSTSTRFSNPSLDSPAKVCPFEFTFAPHSHSLVRLLAHKTHSVINLHRMTGQSSSSSSSDVDIGGNIASGTVAPVAVAAAAHRKTS